MRTFCFFIVEKTVIENSVFYENDDCTGHFESMGDNARMVTSKAFGFSTNNVFFGLHRYSEPEYPSMYLKKSSCRYAPEPGMTICGILSDSKLALDAWFIPSPSFIAFWRYAVLGFCTFYIKESLDRDFSDENKTITLPDGLDCLYEVL